MSDRSGAENGDRSDPASIEQKIRKQAEQLSYLPGSAAVAVKFIEIGKDPEASVSEYETIISSDVALSSKLLSLANSSWYATRQEVTTVIRAINLLGINNVRTLAISYCMAGMYNRLKVPKKELDRYWQASLCKGVAAKTYISALDDGLADEAFMAGLFQDMALPLMHSVACDSLVHILEDKKADVSAQVLAQRRVLGVDHADVGRLLATKLELPDSYVDAIAFHHDPECLRRFVTSEHMVDAIQVSAMFPHMPDQWHPADVELLSEFLKAHAAERFRDRDAFIDAVQSAYDDLYKFLQSGEESGVCLSDLLPEACAELADATSVMMGQMNTLLVEAAEIGAAANELAAKGQKLDDELRFDGLTVAFNRSGFMVAAEEGLAAAREHSQPVAVLYFDVDRFKPTNDVHGHHFGDHVLCEISSRVKERLRVGDIFGRMGGDEFVILITDVEMDEVRTVSDAILKAVRYEPYVSGTIAQKKTISLGALWVPPSACGGGIESLIQSADELMYEAKRSGPGQMRLRAASDSETESHTVPASVPGADGSTNAER